MSQVHFSLFGASLRQSDMFASEVTGWGSTKEIDFSRFVEIIEMLRIPRKVFIRPLALLMLGPVFMSSRF